MEDLPLGAWEAEAWGSAPPLLDAEEAEEAARPPLALRVVRQLLQHTAAPAPADARASPRVRRTQGAAPPAPEQRRPLLLLQP